MDWLGRLTLASTTKSGCAFDAGETRALVNYLISLEVNHPDRDKIKTIVESLRQLEDKLEESTGILKSTINAMDAYYRAITTYQAVTGVTPETLPQLHRYALAAFTIARRLGVCPDFGFAKGLETEIMEQANARKLDSPRRARG
jgi:hypothetical protein